MIAFTVHSTNTAIPIAKPWIVIGKISESSSQTSVPMNVCTNATSSSIAARIKYVRKPDSGSRNDAASTACAAATPMNPMRIIGRRPYIPSRMIPTIVPITEVTPTVIVRISAALAPMPDDFRMVGA
jgi:hypothetical protein